MITVLSDTTIAEMIKAQTDEDEFRELVQTEQEFLNCVGTNKVNPHIEECIMRRDPLEKVRGRFIASNLNDYCR